MSNYNLELTLPKLATTFPAKSKSQSQHTTFISFSQTKLISIVFSQSY